MKTLYAGYEAGYYYIKPADDDIDLLYFEAPVNLGYNIRFYKTNNRLQAVLIKQRQNNEWVELWKLMKFMKRTV